MISFFDYLIKLKKSYMKITHFSNSFIVVEASGEKICCDPWVGVANHGGWHSFPEYERKDLIDFVADSNFVYISHLHSDHLDEKFLCDSGLIDKLFLIKKFDSPTLAKRLRKHGANKILELDSFEVFKCGVFSFSIIPQMTSNSVGVEDDIGYDLDTSILISCGGKNFFNQVDNPLSDENYKFVSDWIKNKYGEIDIAALTVGAASEYPQCFFNVDRDSEKRRIVQSSLERMKKKVEILGAKAFFPAGGTYFIPGKFHELNKYIAQPGNQEILDYADKNIPNASCFVLESGLDVELKPNAEISLNKIKVPLKNNKKKIAIINHSSDLYDFQKSEKIILKDVVEDFEMAKLKWLKYVESEKIPIKSGFIFSIYENLDLDMNLRPSGKILCDFEMHYKKDDNICEIKIHIEKEAFFRCLNKMASWNQTISGSLTMIERNPNLHFPSDLFSLNMLVK